MTFSARPGWYRGPSPRVTLSGSEELLHGITGQGTGRVRVLRPGWSSGPSPRVFSSTGPGWYRGPSPRVSLSGSEELLHGITRQ